MEWCRIKGQLRSLREGWYNSEKRDESARKCAEEKFAELSSTIEAFIEDMDGWERYLEPEP